MVPIRQGFPEKVERVDRQLLAWKACIVVFNWQIYPWIFSLTDTDHMNIQELDHRAGPSCSRLLIARFCKRHKQY